jgi:hypothetical protein
VAHQNKYLPSKNKISSVGRYRCWPRTGRRLEPSIAKPAIETLHAVSHAQPWGGESRVGRRDVFQGTGAPLSFSMRIDRSEHQTNVCI